MAPESSQISRWGLKNPNSWAFWHYNQIRQCARSKCKTTQCCLEAVVKCSTVLYFFECPFAPSEVVAVLNEQREKRLQSAAILFSRFQEGNYQQSLGVQHYPKHSPSTCGLEERANQTQSTHASTQRMHTPKKVGPHARL